MIKDTSITHPKAINQGILKIGEFEIECAVLEDGTRVLNRANVVKSLGRTGKVKGGREYDDDFKVPVFLNANNLKPFINDEILLNSSPIMYSANGKKHIGYKATSLPEFCDVFIKAKEANALVKNQEHIYTQAIKLISAFAKVGIIALVDEATGFQKQKNEYQKILDLYLAKELRPWVMTFDENYYKQLYRLLGWNWDAFKNSKKNHPQYIGRLTNRLVYEKLAPGILDALKKANPTNSKGNRRNRHHQHLSENHGYRELLRLVSAITILMEQFPDGDLTSAIQKIDARFPSFSPFFQTAFDLPIQSSNSKFNDAIRLASQPIS